MFLPHILFLFPEEMKANLLLLLSFLEFPIPNGIAFIGEIGLSGELRMVSTNLISKNKLIIYDIITVILTQLGQVAP